MRTNVYTIYDRKALVYNMPFCAPTDGAATRQFSDLANDTGTTIGRHPNDYVLFRCGTYDDQLGLIQPEVPLAHIMDASALLQLQPNLFGGAPAAGSTPSDHLQNGKA